MKNLKLYDLVMYIDSKGVNRKGIFVGYSTKRARVMRYGKVVTVKVTNLTRAA